MSLVHINKNSETAEMSFLFIVERKSEQQITCRHVFAFNDSLERQKQINASFGRE